VKKGLVQAKGFLSTRRSPAAYISPFYLEGVELIKSLHKKEKKE
jgi:hypothetical protein